MSGESKNGKNPRKGKDGTSATPEQRRFRARNRGAGETADWSSADAILLRRVITAITRHGFAIRLGYTRDMGAYAVGVVGDGEPFTDYLRPTEDLSLWLEEFSLDYEDREGGDIAGGS